MRECYGREPLTSDNDSLLYEVCLYTVRIKKRVIHFQRPIVLKSIDLKIDLKISKEQLILFPLVHTSGMSRITEYIAIEDDNVMTHFLQV